MPNIFLVDDNQLMRQQALRFLEQQDSFTISGEAVNGKEAISKFPDLLPDITIMDFEMPEMNGLEAAQAILKEYPNANILMLSIHLPGQLAVLNKIEARGQQPQTTRGLKFTYNRATGRMDGNDVISIIGLGQGSK